MRRGPWIFQSSNFPQESGFNSGRSLAATWRFTTIQWQSILSFAPPSPLVPIQFGSYFIKSDKYTLDVFRRLTKDGFFILRVLVSQIKSGEKV